MNEKNRFEGLMNEVKGKKDVQTSKHREREKPSTQTSKHSNAQASRRGKSADPDFVRTTIYLPKKLHKKLKAIALEDEREMSDIVEVLVEDWLRSR